MPYCLMVFTASQSDKGMRCLREETGEKAEFTRVCRFPAPHLRVGIVRLRIEHYR